LAGEVDWPGLQQVCKIHRVTKRDGKLCEETQYAVTSVPRDQAEAPKLLGWWRGHWGIENRLFWVRDVTMGEDDSRVRTSSGPQILAGLRNAAITLLRCTGVTNIAEGLRTFAYRVDHLLSTLGIIE
jgi:predicted transposase YbfD/YdcC